MGDNLYYVEVDVSPPRTGESPGFNFTASPAPYLVAPGAASDGPRVTFHKPAAVGKSEAASLPPGAYTMHVDGRSYPVTIDPPAGERVSFFDVARTFEATFSTTGGPHFNRGPALPNRRARRKAAAQRRRA